MKEETINKKRTQLLDMQEHPDRYTEEAFNDLLADEDVRRFAYDMAMTKRAMRKHEREEVDVDRTWKAFSTRHQPRHRNRIKVVAATIGIIFLSSIAFATVLRWGFFRSTRSEIPNHNQPVIAQKHPNTSLQDTIPAQQDSTSNLPIVFDDAELATILNQMAAYYHVEVVFQRKQSKHVRLYFRWNRQKSLSQQLELLNAFDRINLTLSDHTLIVD